MSRRVLFSAIKNEGPFILEWVAYHRVIGFTDVIIVSNDCDDGSAELLDCLHAANIVRHIPQTVPDGVAPQFNAERLARETGCFKTDDWVMWLDLDEFLFPRQGGLGELLASVSNAQADGIALNWRLFGDNGHDGLPSRFISDAFTGAARRRFTPHQNVKTLFRYDECVQRLDLHRPILDADAAPVRMINGRNQLLDRAFLYDTTKSGAPHARVPLERGSYRLGQINHYSVRTRALFDLKQARGRGSLPGKNNRHTAELFEHLNRNELEERDILVHADATGTEMEALSTLPGVAQADANCREIVAKRLAQPSLT